MFVIVNELPVAVSEHSVNTYNENYNRFTRYITEKGLEDGNHPKVADVFLIITLFENSTLMKPEPPKSASACKTGI